MQRLRVGLDWTPNTNHIGLYVARERGWYQDVGLVVDLTTPEDDAYVSTPGRRLAAGEIDVAMTPSESVFSLRTARRPVAVKAIAAVLQRDASAIAVRSASGIHRPADLDGRRYASYSARYEDAIVRAMVRADGGQGTLSILTPARFGIWDTLLTGEADATWIFLPWEGVEARRKGVSLRAFTMDEVGIPYGYSPVLVAREDALAAQPEVFARFVEATRRGYEAAVADPEAAVDDLIRGSGNHPTLQDRSFVVESLAELAGPLLDGGRWGRMEPERWQAFSDWLHAQALLDVPMSADELAVHGL